MINQLNNLPDKSCIYLNVFYNSLEINSVAADILTDARNKYFTSRGKKTKNKVSFSVNGIRYTYLYQILPNGKFKWRATANNVIIEDLITEPSGYVIIYKSANGFINKKAYFNHSHIWQKTEYFINNPNQASVSLMPWLNDDKAAIALYDGVTSFPQILYVLENCENNELLTVALNRCCPNVKATVNGITYYFGDDETEKQWNNILHQKGYIEKPFVQHENVKTYFNISNFNSDAVFSNFADTTNVFGQSELDKVPQINDFEDKNQQLDNNFTNDLNIHEDEDVITNNTVELNKNNFENHLHETPKLLKKKSSDTALISADKNVMISQKEKGIYYGDLDSSNNRCGYGRTATSKGKTLYEGEYSGDLKNGFGVSYFKTGKVSHIGNYKDDKYEGIGIEFRATDGCMTVADFTNNSKEYILAKFDKAGNLLFAGNSFAKNSTGVTFNTENGEMFIPRTENGEILNKGTIISSNGVLLYNGDYKNGNKDGSGTTFNIDGSIKYTGTFKRNVYSGKGTLFYENGNVYKGEFLSGLPSGTGELKDKNANIIYTGQWKKGVYNGEGKLYKPDGVYCVGRFVNGEAKGKLSIYNQYGIIIYYGTVNNEKPDGNGICYINGVKYYDGQLSDGVKSGTGRLYKDGECVYMGTFENDLFSGFGISYNNSKQEYCGMWSDNKYNGAGILKLDNETSMAGNFLNGLPNGRVNIIKNNILIRECIYVNGECEYMHEYSSDGSSIIYDGNVKDNIREGMGCVFSDYGEKQFEGIFKNGEPLKSMKVSLKDLEPLEYVAKLKDTDYEKFRHSKEFVVEQPMLDGVYSGQLSDGVPDGKGTILYVDHRYTGYFKNGTPCGNGIIYFGDGTVVKGTFSDTPLVNTKPVKFSNIIYYRIEQ